MSEARPRVPRRRLLVPEVVQTSTMDCGPASLKCLLEGFGVPVSYDRLREACQTDVDGTSIDTIEDVATKLGLDAHQTMVPVDHLLMPEMEVLPALVVARLPNGVPHFIVIWSRHGGIAQVMDPATGRRWPTCGHLLEDIYVHSAVVPAAAWRAFASSPASLRALRRRLARLGVASEGDALLEAAASDAGWRALASLDAATRMLSSLVRAGAIRRGREAARMLRLLVKRGAPGAPALEDQEVAPEIPEPFWSVLPGPPGPDAAEQVIFRGAVLVTVRGLHQAASVERPSTRTRGAAATPALSSPALLAALQQPSAQPGWALLAALRADGWSLPAALTGALALGSLGGIVTAVLLRSVFDLREHLVTPEQRFGAVAALIALLAALLLLELTTTTGALRSGRRLEARLRLDFLSKIPRLTDRYLQSRLTSDMAERCHSVHRLRALPLAVLGLLRSVMELSFTTAGIAWIDPGSAGKAVAAAALAVGIPLGAQGLLAERELRVRVHSGALSRFYLDALLGLTAVRTHGAERVLRREHEGLLVEWVRASRALLRAVLGAEGLSAAASFALAGWLFIDHVGRSGGIPGALLLLFWALSLPSIGQQLALSARQLPSHRNVALRLLEPLAAVEEPEATPAPAAVRSGAPGTPGAAIRFARVRVIASGHTILDGIDLTIAAGEHLAVVGPSGAGKSSLVGLLLGWHRPASGVVLVDGEPLEGERLDLLRRETAWVDPGIQLWNRSLLENLRCGEEAPRGLGRIIEEAELRGVIERLPEGLQSSLGEGGTLVSGGEGQRVRLGRAMNRAAPRLVILDEPFRGLDREQRRALLERARARWRGATLLCVTHDIGETRSFDRVLVIEHGRVVEDGAPALLAVREGSRYRAQLDAEEDVRRGLWSSVAWRRLRVEGGEIVEARRADA